MKQRQFLNVVDEDVAHEAFRTACAHLSARTERVALEHAHGRVLAADVIATVDVPGFDRSNVDGYAVRAVDTYGAEELDPVTVAVSPVTLAAGDAPADSFEAPPGTAVQIATGGVVPRGSDAVVMPVEDDPLGLRYIGAHRSIPRIAMLSSPRSPYPVTRASSAPLT